MSEKCFCHLNGYTVKDATARKQMPLIAQAMLEFQNFTYNDLYNKWQAKTELEEGLHKDWFNKSTNAGERFFAVAVTSDKITVAFTAEVIRVGTSGTVHFKLLDLVTMYRAPLMILYTLEPNKTKEVLLAGFSDSASVATFNRRPLVGEYFYTTLKTPQNDVLTMTARVTGINSAGYAEFESVEVILIHDGTATGGGTKIYIHTLAIPAVDTAGTYYLCIYNTQSEPYTATSFFNTLEGTIKNVIVKYINNNFILYATKVGITKTRVYYFDFATTNITYKDFDYTESTEVTTVTEL